MKTKQLKGGKRHVTMKGGRHRGVQHGCPLPPDRTTKDVDCYCEEGYRWCPHAKQCTKIIYRTTQEEEERVPCKPGYWRCSDQVCYRKSTTNEEDEEDNKRFNNNLKEALDEGQADNYSAFRDIIKDLNKYKPGLYFTTPSSSSSSSPQQQYLLCNEFLNSLGVQLNRQTKQLKYDKVYISLKIMADLICKINSQMNILYKSLEPNSNSTRIFKQKHMNNVDILNAEFDHEHEQMAVMITELESAYNAGKELRDIIIKEGVIATNKKIAIEIREKIEEIGKINPDENNNAYTIYLEQLPKILTLNKSTSSVQQLNDIKEELKTKNNILNPPIIDNLQQTILMNLNSLETEANNSEQKKIATLRTQTNKFIDNLRTQLHLTEPFKNSLNSLKEDYSQLSTQQKMRIAMQKTTKETAKLKEEILIMNKNTKLLSENQHYMKQVKQIENLKSDLTMNKTLLQKQTIVEHVNSIIIDILKNTVKDLKQDIQDIVPPDIGLQKQKLLKRCNELMDRINKLKRDKVKSIETIVNELDTLNDDIQEIHFNNIN